MIKIRTPKTCCHAPLTQSKTTMSFSADDARTMMLSQKEVTEETPFGREVLVYKVCGKMFATLGFDESLPTSLVTELIGHSHELVVKGLPAKLRNLLSGGDD